MDANALEADLRAVVARAGDSAHGAFEAFVGFARKTVDEIDGLAVSQDEVLHEAWTLGDSQIIQVVRILSLADPDGARRGTAEVGLRWRVDIEGKPLNVLRWGYAGEPTEPVVPRGEDPDVSRWMGPLDEWAQDVRASRAHVAVEAAATEVTAAMVVLPALRAPAGAPERDAFPILQTLLEQTGFDQKRPSIRRLWHAWVAWCAMDLTDIGHRFEDDDMLLYEVTGWFGTGAPEWEGNPRPAQWLWSLTRQIAMPTTDEQAPLEAMLAGVQLPLHPDLAQLLIPHGENRDSGSAPGQWGNGGPKLAASWIRHVEHTRSFRAALRHDEAGERLTLVRERI